MLIVRIGQVTGNVRERAGIQLGATANVITGLLQINERGLFLVLVIFVVMIFIVVIILVIMIIVLFFLMMMLVALATRSWTSAGGWQSS